MNKHTPGPWTHGRAMENWSIDIYSPQKMNGECDWVASVHQQFTSMENGMANARLIAASPDLYEFAQWLKTAIENGYHNDEQDLLADAMDRAKNILNRINNG